ncbi:Hsp20/alpha crystallin family protein [Dictyobacter formicarum]|uniref:Heat-shock protein Hsp20 n=1 Tax=Dictyobacter formicarum TaxID=2778368 RepID=A0ABQ3VSH7_9CHLR|nr:Hsp20/alpha crystallin family protein [Dictyobacter formicarum]GHO88584.1 heat-shock protein Hsp20 [Dictyobacter formicarum]
MLAPRDPLDALMPLREAMSRLFEESFVTPRFEMVTSRTIPLDVYETDDKKQYMIEASLSGFKPDEIQVTAEDNVIRIHAAKKEQKEQKEKESYIKRERYVSEVERAIALPTHINADKIQASYENGVLTLTAPKLGEAKTKQVPVKVKETAGPH